MLSFRSPPSAVARRSGPRHLATPIRPRGLLRLPLVPPTASKGFGSAASSSSNNNKPPPPNKKSGGGDGGGGESSTGGGGGSKRMRTADPEVQRAATLLLTALVAETDPAKRTKIAADNVDKIDGVFFAVADAYIKMARAEQPQLQQAGGAAAAGAGEDVAAGLESAVRCALDAKQATLRPEIRLLNRMLDAPSLEARRGLLEEDGGAAARLLRERASREYLGQLLDTFERDVKGQAKRQQQQGAAEGGKEAPVVALQRAIDETRSIVRAAAVAAGG